MSVIISNLLDKLKPKDVVYSCKYINNSIIFDCKNRIKLCPYSDFGIIKNNYDGIWFNTDLYNKVKTDCISDINNNNAPINCKKCFNYNNNKYNNGQEIKTLYISNWHHCYLNCKYCEYPKEEDLIKAGHYDIFPTIKQMLDNKIINQNTKVIFECGDPCIHPEFDKILFYFINYEMKNIVINTPAQRYCESVAEAIAKNIAQVVITFDSGCPYIYERVKGTNKFDLAMFNIKRYLAFQEPGEKRVILKYNIINGVNDNQKEILDWFMLSRDIGIRKLALDIDIKWYNQIKDTIPKYLKELITFAKNISDYNNIEIEFGEAAQAIYMSIKKEEK